MKWIIAAFLISVFASDITKTGLINQLKKEAETAYASGDYSKAIDNYSLLVDSLKVNEAAVYQNMANAFFQIDSLDDAQRYYMQAAQSNDPSIKTKAHQQLGVIAHKNQDNALALNHFKRALLEDPGNSDARYNYEVLKNQQKNQKGNNDEDIEPSEYAKKLKDRADNLANANQFEQALSLMQTGLNRDNTVKAYNDFISKLNDIVDSRN